MPIRVTCPSCKKTLAVPDSAAGKAGKCNSCGTKMLVPVVVQTASPAPPPVLAPPPLPPPIPEPPSRKCPFCSESIQHDAAKCRWCGEYIDPSLREQMRRERETEAYLAAKGSAASKGKPPGPMACGLMSVLLPGLGQLAQGRQAAGVGWFVASAVGYAFLFVPGMLIHAVSVMDAAGWKVVPKDEPPSD